MACAESSPATRASKETKGTKRRGETSEMRLCSVMQRVRTEKTPRGCVVVRETLVLSEDGGIMYIAAPAGTEED